MGSTGDHTAEELARLAMIPLRTVRFYLAEKLIDPPLGRGRGAHFTDHHLEQLRQVRVLHNAGFVLDAIRERRAELLAYLNQAQRSDAYARGVGGPRIPQLTMAQTEPGEPAARDDPDAAPEGFMRIPMAQGVDLLVADDKPLPSPKQLVDIALYIRKVFGDR
jgi:DNA-binding transcriptional MerR regulator